MSRTITINHVTRIEGHAKIDIFVDDAGQVSGAQFHVTQVRGFEKFTEGRPFYEMPSITARICGICPVSHLLASAKACDEIMAVRIPPAAAKLRELVHCAQFVQSHALSFFHLSAPDLLLGMDSDPAERNVFGLVAKHPDIARDGIALRKFGQQAIERIAGERIHPAGIVGGGMANPLSEESRAAIRAGLPEAKAIAIRALDLLKGELDHFRDEIESFGNMPTMYAGLVNRQGGLEIYDGQISFVDAAGELVAGGIEGAEYQRYIGEQSLRDSYLKAPYYVPLGYPQGIYRVGPLGRLNVAERVSGERAAKEFAEYHERAGGIAQSAFFAHYARLVEIMWALERMEALLDDAGITSTHVRARAQVNAAEGVGVIEAPRGLLIHHYKVDDNGAITWANLIVATGHNNLAMNKSIEQVSRRFVDGAHLKEGMLNRVSAVVRAYDPCLSCSTHADGLIAMQVRLIGSDGEVRDELRVE